MSAGVALVKPARTHLASYVAALEAGWSPDNVRGLAAAVEQLARIDTDADAFLASLDDPEARGPPWTMPDGTKRARLPGFTRWIWDGEFCGSIGFRWRADGDSTLPDHVLGHIGFAVVPWKRGRGYAGEALRLTLTQARARRLAYVELTTLPDNIASQRVVTRNGGVFVKSFEKDAAYGGGETYLYRIDL